MDAGVHEYHDDESVCQRPKKNIKIRIKFGFSYWKIKKKLEKSFIILCDPWRTQIRKKGNIHTLCLGSCTPLPDPNPISRFCHSLFLFLHTALDFGQGRYFCRHMANSRSHSHNWWEHELRSVFEVFPGTVRRK